MKIFIFVLLFLISFNSYSWYCLEVASERLGDTINACGIGEALDEDAARKVALNNAYKELDLICSHSSDCVDKALEITPLRTDCKKVDLIYRCHRGITAAITSKPRDLSQTHLLQEVFIPKKIIQQDGSNYFQKTSIVDFNSNPQGARVHVDGVEICQTPCVKEIDQGEHKFSFEKEDYEYLAEVRQIGEGRQDVHVNLQQRYGYLTILGLPEDAVIKVNNKEITSKDRIRLNPNEHVITVTSKYFQPWFKQFQIKKGETLQYKYDAEALVGHVKISATDSKGNPIEASIMINGEKLSQKTPTAMPVKAGRSLVTLSNSDYKDLTFEITLNADDKMEIKKELISKNYKSGAWYLGFGFSPAPFKDFSKEDKFSCCLLIDLAYQKNLTNHFSLKFSYNNSSDVSGSKDAYTTEKGTPNTTSYKAYEATGHLLFLSLPIYLSKDDHFSWYIAPEIGRVKSKLKYNQYDYSSFGNGYQSSTSREATFTQSFNGLALGWEWLNVNNPKSTGWYFILGARKYDQPKDISFNFNQNQTQTPKSNSVQGYTSIGWLLAY